MENSRNARPRKKAASGTELKLIQGKKPASGSGKHHGEKMRADVVTELDIIEADPDRRNHPPLRRRLSAEDRIQIKKRRRRKVLAARMTLAGSVLVLVFLLFFLVKIIAGPSQTETMGFIDTLFSKDKMTKIVRDIPKMSEEYLTVNEYSRPGEELKEVKDIFIHYTANPGTSAEQNRSYFENLGTTGETSASAHFVIGYDGEIIQCIPLDEIGYAVKSRNYDSVSIECCYTDESGHFTQATYTSLLHLTSWLMGKYNLSPDDVYRHYDEGGKKCPKYYVDNPDAWTNFKVDLENYIDKCGTDV